MLNWFYPVVFQTVAIYRELYSLFRISHRDCEWDLSRYFFYLVSPFLVRFTVEVLLQPYKVILGPPFAKNKVSKSNKNLTRNT